MPVTINEPVHHDIDPTPREASLMTTTPNDQTTSVHGQAAQLGRQLASARDLLARLDGLGIKRTKRLDTVDERRANIAKLTSQLRMSANTTGHAVTEAAFNADPDALVDALTEQDRTGRALDALTGTELLARLTTDETSAIHASATEHRDQIVTAFNAAGAKFAETMHDKFNNRLIPSQILGTPAGEYWTTLTDTARVLDSAAAVLDTIDATDPGDVRYARNLAHPAAATRTYAPHGGSLVVAAGYHPDSTGIDSNRQYSAGWEWLADPALDGIREWVRLATADPRPGASIIITIDTDAERADHAAFTRMHAAWKQHDQGTNSVREYARTWWNTNA